ncbi:hypothetical protein [Acidocella sp.]|uniref:hypothetical protein n=1 Tax=Acidocella sp. TaxID=50710 RepID=UPI00262A5546|nr:hypothetical protein [Acidocella sp.]
MATPKLPDWLLTPIHSGLFKRLPDFGARMAKASKEQRQDLLEITSGLRRRT